MIDLTNQERALLARLESPDSFVYRQADIFVLVIAGMVVCELKTELCKNLIDKQAIVEIGQDTSKEHPDWIYAADPRLFAPAFEIDHSKDNDE